MPSRRGTKGPDLTTFKQLPPLPQIVRRLLEILSGTQPSVTEVVAAVTQDGAFAAEILRLVNSPLVGLPRKVKSVHRATTVIGTERLRAVALTATLRGYFMKHVPKTALRPAWSHSVATALVAEKLAHCCGLGSDLGYSGGLLHDIGRLAQISVHTPVYRRFLEVAKHYDTDILRLEREQFGADHCELAVVLAEAWMLPENLARAAKFHHSAPRDKEATVVTLTRFGCQLADILGFPAIRPLERRRREARFQEMSVLAQSLWQVDLEHLRTTVFDRVRAVEQTLQL